MKFFKKRTNIFSDVKPRGITTGAVGASKISIGRFSYGYETLEVKEWGEGANLSIGSFCSIAQGLTVMLGGNHRTDWVTTFPFGYLFTAELGGEDIVGHPTTNGDVVVGHDVWLGRNVTIMSGVKIGNGAVVAANSVVVKDIGDYEVWGGNPAKRLKARFTEELTRDLLDLAWWDFDEETIKQIAPLISQVPTQDLLAEVRKIAGAT